jgi:hypothetical protein
MKPTFEKVAVGVTATACEKPDEWDAIAASNSRALEKDMATRKSLCSGSKRRAGG